MNNKALYVDRPLPVSDNRAIRIVLCTFSSLGVIWGAWQVLLADIQQALQLSKGELGSAITIGVAAAIPSMLLGGRLSDRWGPRTIITATSLLMGLALIGLAVANHYWVLCAVLALQYASSGAYDVAINAAAIGAEQTAQRRIMTYFHATFSGAAAFAGIFAGLLLFLGTPFRTIYCIVAVLTVVLALLVWLDPTFGRPMYGHPKVGEHGIQKTRLFLVPAIVLIAAITSLGSLSEGTLQSWSAVYLRISLDLPVILGAAGPAVLHAAMLIGRLASAYVVARLGLRTLLCISGLLTAAGMGLALATTTPSLILLGILTCGLALSGVAPAAYSLAGDIAPKRAGEVTSIITTISYSGFLIGPALIGSLAEALGLRIAMGTVILAGLMIALLSLFLRRFPQREINQHLWLSVKLMDTRACLQSSSDAAFRKSQIEEWRGSMVSLQTRSSGL